MRAEVLWSDVAKAANADSGMVVLTVHEAARAVAGYTRLSVESPARADNWAPVEGILVPRRRGPALLEAVRRLLDPSTVVLLMVAGEGHHPTRVVRGSFAQVEQLLAPVGFAWAIDGGSMAWGTVDVSAKVDATVALELSRFPDHPEFRT